MVNFPEELKLEPATKVMAPFTKLRSPVPIILASSGVVRFIPNPELNPIPKEPPSETLMVVEPVPLLRVPVKTRSLAVTVSALLVVDKEPDEIVKSPEPLFSRSAPRATAPLAVKLAAIVIPELALRVAAPAAVSVLLIAILPFDESVNAPFAVSDPVEAPRVMFPADEVMAMPLARVSVLPPCRLTFAEPVSVLLLSVKPLLAVIVTDPAETSALLTLIVEAVEVRVRFPDEVVLPAARGKAPAELKVIPLPKDNVEEFALMFKASDEVEMPLFKVIPEFAVMATAPVAVMAPVIVMLVGAVRVKAPAVVIPPLAALREMLLALVKVIPLANVMLSFADKVSTVLSESPSRLRAPVVVVRLALTSMPFSALAFKVENEEAEPSKITAPFEPDTCASTFSSTPFVKVDVVWVIPLT